MKTRRRTTLRMSESIGEGFDIRLRVCLEFCREKCKIYRFEFLVNPFQVVGQVRDSDSD